MMAEEAKKQNKRPQRGDHDDREDQECGDAQVVRVSTSHGRFDAEPPCRGDGRKSVEGEETQEECLSGVR